VVHRIQWNPILRTVLVHLDWLTPYQGILEMTGFKVGTAGTVGEDSTESQAMGKEDEADHRRQKHDSS
jgi:hypothetical protein